MNSYLDHYCERIDAQLWGEPFNVLSNLAILVIALFVMRTLTRTGMPANRSWWDFWLLSGLIIAIAAGSSIWHLFATNWTLWADRIPILLFISVFMISCLLRTLKIGLLPAIVLFILFQIGNAGMQLWFPAGTLNGSIFYLPTLALLAAITAIFWVKNSTPIKHHFLSASLLFTVAIVFRSIDIVVCDSLPVGTHFVWHLLVAASIYLLMLGLIYFCKDMSGNEK